MSAMDAEILAELKAIRALLETRPQPAPVAPGTTGSAVRSVGMLPNYGRGKGQPIAGADAATLEYYIAGCQRTLADPEKQKFWARERTMLAALEAELMRQNGGAKPAPAAFGEDTGEIPF